MSDAHEALTAFVSFPSPYTQTLLLRALTATLPALSLSLLPPDPEAPPRLQWADYDLMTFDVPHRNPSYLLSSYVYRKALIRKHQLHQTVTEYLAKASHRGIESSLTTGVPQGWTIDVQFADELDELLMDDLYELADAMHANEGKDAEDRQWFILKPGFADRAQGIRLFSTEEEMRDIFEEFEPPSSDEEDDDEDDDDESDEDSDAEEPSSRPGAEGRESGVLEEQTRKLALGDGDGDGDDSDDEGNGGTAVMTSHLRHFVIQELLPDPVLFDLKDTGAGHKFHLRAYVLVTGSWTVHLSRTMLALFAGAPFSPPSAGGDIDLQPHLTNTCLQVSRAASAGGPADPQTDAFGAPVPEDDLVRLFWDLEGEDALAYQRGGYAPRGKITSAWLDGVFARAGDVCAEAVRAGAECGSFGLQLMPNAFEIFGVDLVLTHPPPGSPPDTLPRVALLEFNASPDFVQSGDALRPRLFEMFKGVVHIAVAPLFGLQTIDTEEEDKKPEDWDMGEEHFGWRLVGKGQVRAQWA